MKKLLLIIALIASASAVQAQKGFYAGVRGAYNSTWLFNKNVSDAGDELDYKSSFGAQYGLSLVYMFSENAGISLDPMLGSVNQKYTFRFDRGNGVEDKAESETKMTNIDLPVLFRFVLGADAFIEVGPQFSLISKVETSGDGIPTTEVEKDDRASSYISAVLGFGYDIALTDNLHLAPGLRFAWGLTDTGKDNDVQGYEPTNAAVGGLTVALTYRFGDN